MFATLESEKVCFICQTVKNDHWEKTIKGWIEKSGDEGTQTNPTPPFNWMELPQLMTTPT